MHMVDIAVEDFSAADIDGFLAYWYDSDAAQLLAMGVDPSKLPRRAKMHEMLEFNLARDVFGGTKQNAILSIKLAGQTVGVHEMTHMVAREGGLSAGAYVSGIMHAHIWRAEHRGLGIALVSYVAAMRRFFERFHFDAIVFESPAGNIAANRIKDKLGIAAKGEGTIDLPILSEPLRTLRYEVTPADMPAIAARMQLVWQQRQAARAR